MDLDANSPRQILSNIYDQRDKNRPDTQNKFKTSIQIEDLTDHKGGDVVRFPVGGVKEVR